MIPNTEYGKYYKTIAGILVEGGSPEQIGFENYKEHISNIQSTITSKNLSHSSFIWKDIQRRAKDNIDILQKQPVWEDIKWLVDYDFDTQLKNTKKDLQKSSIKKHLKSVFPRIYDCLYRLRKHIKYK